MSISFSGLASGLDTSSWVESLVALKKAKVETYEEEKSKVQTTQETLSKIKSFFTSFRSMLEKVTDAKFGVGSMDIFAQKLANSSDTSILTAAATTEAEEATYDVTVDKLATGTQAVSGFKSMTTIIQSETATLGTKLSAIGVKAGEIGVTVNGTKHTVTIGENDTISNFISKMKNIGVDASYSEASGVFSINLSASAIDDTITKHADGSVGTGIVKALHLESTGGYESADLKITNSETIVSAATGGTKLSELGTIKAGNIEVKANNTSYNISIDGNTTLANLINNLQSKGIEARLSSDGILQIKDAEIIDSGNTGIISALGLEMDVNSKTQTATGLKTVTITTTESAATGATKISELGTIKNGGIEVKANGTTYTITIDQDTTLSELVSSLTSKGVDASLSGDGVFTIKNAEIVDSGSTGIVSALGLTQVVNNKSQSSGDLTTRTVSTSKSAATSSTKISSLVGGEGLKDNDTVIVENKSGKYTTITLKSTSTIGDLVIGLNDAGLTAAIDSNGVFSLSDGKVNGGSFDVMKVLGLSTSQTVSVNATSDTKLSDITSERTFSVKDKDGNIVANITLSNDATIETLFSKLSEQGISGSISNGVITLNSTNGNYITGALPKALGIGIQIEGTQTVTTGSTSTSDEPIHYVTQVTGNTTITIASTATSSDKLTYSTVINSTTTSTVAVDITSSSGVYYTTITTSGSTPTPTPSEKTDVTLVSSKAVLATHSTSGTMASFDAKTPEIVVTNPILLSNAIGTYNTIGIGSAEVLAKLATIVNGGNSLQGKTIVLTDDIDLSGYKSGTGWTPIGNSDSHAFKGNFDGNGHTISNLYINADTLKSSSTDSFSNVPLGLFGYASGGTIENVGLKDVNVSSNYCYHTVIASLVGTGEDLTINNCYVTGSISASFTKSASSDYYIGGLVGHGNSLNINNSYSLANVSSNIAISEDISLGGLVGDVTNATISNSYVAGNVSINNSYACSSSTYQASGGLIGSVSNATISNSYFLGKVSSTGYHYNGSVFILSGGIAGIISSNSLEVRNCYTAGTIISTNTDSSEYNPESSCSGGIIGGGRQYVQVTVDVSNTFVAGEVKLGANSSIGIADAFMGYLYSGSKTLSSCYYNNVNTVHTGYSKNDSYALDASAFNQDFYKDIGYNENNGWLFTSSTTAPVRSEFYQINAKTTLKDLLGDGCAAQTLVVQGSDGNKTVTIGAEDSIYEKFKEAGLEISINSGKVTLKGKYVSLSQDLYDALGLEEKDDSTSGTGTSGGIQAVELSSTSAVRYENYTSNSSSYPSESTVVTRTSEYKYDSISALINRLEFAPEDINYVTINNSGTVKIITIDPDKTTIKDFFDSLEKEGIKLYFNKGIVSFSGDSSHYIMGMTAGIRTAFNLTSGVGYTVTSSGTSSDSGSSSSGSGSTSTITTIFVNSSSSSLALSSVGVNSTNYITVKNGDTISTVTVTGSTTVRQLTADLARVGITTDVTNGKFTFSGTDSSYILGMTTNLKSALNLMDSGGKGYTVKSEQTTSTQVVTLTSANTDIKLYALGVNGTNLITVQNGNTTATLVVDSTSTLADMTSALAKLGISSSIEDGKITFTGDDSHYIIGMSSNLANALNLSSGSTYTTTVTETSTTQTLTVSNSNSTVKMSDIGATRTNYITVRNGSTTTIITLGTDSTIADMTSALTNAGISVDIADGRFTFSGDSEHYIIGMSTNLANMLHLATGNNNSYITSVESTYGNTNSNVLKSTGFSAETSTVFTQSTSTSVVGATRDTLLSELGVTAGEFYVYTNGEKKTAVISSDETIGSFIDKINAMGIQAGLINNGSKSNIILSGSGDSYIAKSNNNANASNIVDTLFGGTSAVVNESSYSGVESITTKVTATVGATESTALSSLGVTAGEYYIYNNGVKYTALISSEETLGSFMDTLKSFGIQTGLINNGGSASLILIGNGNSYVAKSNSVNNASNVVDKLFGTSETSTSYSYKGSELLYNTVTHTTSATTDSLLSEFDTPWGNTTLKSAGDLVVMVNGEAKTLRISETETFGSLVDKFKNAGIQADFLNGKLYITNAGDLSVIADRTTSSLFNANTNLRLTSKDKLNGFMSSTATVQSTTTIIEEHSASASAYADMDTKLSTLGIKGGSLSIYRNGEKALITIEDSHTLGDVRSLISKKFSNVDMKFNDDGKLVFYSTDKDVSVELGNTTDKSNFLAVTGVVKTKDGTAESARALYTVNGDSKVMADKIFRRGNVKEGSFFVGTERFEINANTTINDVVSMINNAEGANATAYWDTIDGKLVIKSRSSGAALINIEAGTSNFTDIMGFTSSEWNKDDGSLIVSRMNVDTQELGSNAQFRINGTSYTATSNIITSDITKIKGVTLNLNGLTSGSAIKVTVEKDKESVASALSDIVDSYNELMNNIDEAIAKEGALKNQTTLKMIRNQLRSLMTSSDLGATTFRNLSAIGISVEAASASNISTSNSSIINLNFDKDAFFKAYEADADAVKALLIGGKDNKGIFTNVETLVDNALQSVSGYFAVTESAYNRELTNWNTKITKANKEIDRYKSRLEKKFSSMDLTISNMQQQYSTFLS